MLNVSDGTKRLFLSDSTQKELIIHVEGDDDVDLSQVNWWYGSAESETTQYTPRLTCSTSSAYPAADGPKFVYDTEQFELDYEEYVSNARWSYYIKGATTQTTRLPQNVNVFTYGVLTDNSNRTYSIIEKTTIPFSVFTSSSGYRVVGIEPLYRGKDRGRYKFYISRVYISIEPDSTYIEGTSTFKFTSFTLSTPQLELLVDSQLEYPVPTLNHDDITTGEFLSKIRVAHCGPVIPDFTNVDIVSETFSLNESICSKKDIKFGLCEASYCNFTIANRTEDLSERYINPYIKIKGTGISIPLGVFKVDKTNKTQNYTLVKQNVTAYDKLTSLDTRVGDWFNNYMIAFNTGNTTSTYSPKYTNYGFEYARQWFPVFLTVMQNLGIMKHSFRRGERSLYANFNSAFISTGQDYGFNYLTPAKENVSGDEKIMSVGIIQAGSINVDGPSYYKVSTTNGLLGNAYTEEARYFQLKTYLGDDWFNKYNYNGLGTHGSVFIDLLDSTNNVLAKYVCDSGDIVYVPHDMYGKKIVKMNISMTAQVCEVDKTTGKAVGKSGNYTATASILNVYEMIPNYNTPLLFPKVNMETKLVYYSYRDRKIASINGSTTFRDVLRSLLEITGCFFKIDRYGNHKLIYPENQALYPSINLYPYDRLYPAEPNGGTIFTAHYRSLQFESYQVAKFNKIQILTGSSADNKKICAFEYTGDRLGIHNMPYVIDDNLFYSNATVDYANNQPEVLEMLKNLYSVIDNLDYTPLKLTCIGQPYIECGDRLSVLTYNGGIEAFIFKRNLKGIQSLTDVFEAEGDEYIKPALSYNDDLLV